MIYMTDTFSGFYLRTLIYPNFKVGLLMKCV